jgi:VanZ family protein
VLLIIALLPGEGLESFQKSNKVFYVLFSDNSLHFFSFGVLAWFLCYVYCRVRRVRWPYFRAFVVSVAYGLFIELIQIWIPYRFFSLADLAMDVAGALVALGLYFVFFSEKGTVTFFQG